MILMIDNYDSFTYNLVHYLEMLDADVKVLHNDNVSLMDIQNLNPEMIVISPGPGTPVKAGLCTDIVRFFKGNIPILGICLGHQVIGEAFGAQTVRAGVPVHGKVLPVCHSGKGVFRGLHNPLNVTRYHSLVLERDTLPECLAITAESPAGEIMGIRHKDYLIEGVQFHPEAVLTEGGLIMLKNFLLEAQRFREGCNADKDI